MVENNANSQEVSKEEPRKVADPVALENSYQVWAMVKQQRNQDQNQDMSSVYITDNKVVAKFSTVRQINHESPTSGHVV